MYNKFSFLVDINFIFGELLKIKFSTRIYINRIMKFITKTIVDL